MKHLTTTTKHAVYMTDRHLQVGMHQIGYLDVYVNPDDEDIRRLTNSNHQLFRLTADNNSKTVYLWDYSKAHHSDLSIALGLGDRLDSIDFLKGHAGVNSYGLLTMVGSDYLQSFVGKMVRGDREFLSKLLDHDWGWLEGYIQVKAWIGCYRARVMI